MTNRTRIFLRYLFVILFGVFLHFAYQLSGENPIVGLFASINESTWEHLKLLFFPMLVLTIWDIFVTAKNNLYFLPARTIGILAGLMFIIIVFYTTRGVIGTNITFIDILIYLFSVVFSFWIEKKQHRKCIHLSVALAIGILLLLTILFIIFTIAPPPLGIFDTIQTSTKLTSEL
jgi:hypothetical protein